jgi:hypothetical protein
MSVTTSKTDDTAGVVKVRNAPTNLVTLSGEVNRTYRDMSRERMSLAATGGSEAALAYADELVTLWNSLTEAERKIGDSKTETGAYLYRAVFLATGDKAKASAAVKERLGIKSPTRYGYLARLHFTFSFDFTDREWPALVRAADGDPDFRKLLNREAKGDEKPVQRKDLLDHLAKREAEKAAKALADEAKKAAIAAAEKAAAQAASDAATDTANSTSTGGTSTGETPEDQGEDKREARPNGLGVTATRTRGAMLTELDKTRGEFGTPRDATEWARLYAIVDAMMSALDAADSDVREEGQAKAAHATADLSA